MSAASSQPSGHAEALPFEPLREALLARGRRAGLFNACSALYTLLGLNAARPEISCLKTQQHRRRWRPVPIRIRLCGSATLAWETSWQC